jgi:hypothetical protein
MTQLTDRDVDNDPLAAASRGAALFSVGTRSYDWVDTVIAAMIRGDWEPVEKTFRQAHACAEAAAEGDEDPAQSDIDRAADQFRYARNLITADETEQWLDRCGIEFDDWIDHLHRSVLRAKNIDRLDELVRQYPTSDEELSRSLYVDLLCSGHLERLMLTLAGHAALSQTSQAPDRRLDENSEQRIARACIALFGNQEQNGGALDQWVQRVRDIARVEYGFETSAQKVITPAMIESKIGGQPIDWIQVSWRFLALPEEEAAREAVLCMRLEGDSLEDIAAKTGLSVHQEQVLLERIDPAVQPLIVSARPNEVVGPVASGGAFLIAVVDEKAAASDTAAAVRERAESAALEQLISEHLRDVRWHQRW